MDYSQKIPDEDKILEGYELLSYGYEGTSKTRASLRSSLMFLERYHDLLKPNGRLITVIDDSILSGKKYKIIRDYIREKFIIRAIISLHGDAFQRVGARAKTSLLYLIKRAENDTSQPDVFMYESRYIGLDDVPPKTPASIAEKAIENAQKETKEILKAFKAFLDGGKGKWLIPSSRIEERLDVKYCIPRKDDVSEEWEENGYPVLKLENIVDPVDGPYVNPKEEQEQRVTLLQITYEGIPQEGESRLGREITYDKLMKIQVNDHAISNIAVSLGSTAVITNECDAFLTTPEYTILRIKDNRFKPYYLWGILRSKEIRARLLSQATGISRQRVKWDFLKTLPIPLLPTEIQEEVALTYQKSVESLNAYEKLKKKASDELNNKLNLDNEWATQRLIRAKATQVTLLSQKAPTLNTDSQAPKT